jgi:hypothetical protein
MEIAVRTAIKGIIDVSNEAPTKVGSPQPGMEIIPFGLSGGTGIFPSSIHLRGLLYGVTAYLPCPSFIQINPEMGELSRLSYLSRGSPACYPRSVSLA